MKQSRLREVKMQQEEAQSAQDFEDSTLSFLSVPEKLHHPSGRQDPSAQRLTEMFAGVLNKQELVAKATHYSRSTSNEDPKVASTSQSLTI